MCDGYIAASRSLPCVGSARRMRRRGLSALAHAVAPALELAYVLSVRLNDVHAATTRLGLALAECPNVRLGFLFGSRARGQARANSDYDIAVLMDDRCAGSGSFRTISDLAARLGREVSSTKLDLVLLNDAPILLRHRVLRDGTLLYQRTAADRVRFVIRTIRDYQDGTVRRAEFTRRRIDRLKAGVTDGGCGDLLEKARSTARLLGKAQSVS